MQDLFHQQDGWFAKRPQTPKIQSIKEMLHTIVNDDIFNKSRTFHTSNTLNFQNNRFHQCSPVLKSVLQVVQYSGPSFSCEATIQFHQGSVLIVASAKPLHLREAQEKGSAVSLVGIGGSAGIKSPLGQELVETWPTKTWEKNTWRAVEILGLEICFV